jgi:hypothetical protein
VRPETALQQVRRAEANAAYKAERVAEHLGLPADAVGNVAGFLLAYLVAPWADDEPSFRYAQAEWTTFLWMSEP